MYAIYLYVFFPFLNVIFPSLFLKALTTNQSCYTIYSNLSDYKNAPFEAAKKGEYDKIKAEELDPLARKFQNAVKNKRGDKLKHDTEGLLSGRMFYQDDALEVGLIDHVGNLDFAVSRVRSKRIDATMFEYVKSKL